MARLGIDDQFWLEIISVIAKLGDQDRAIGMVVRFFRYAQEKHKHGRLVTEDEFKFNGFDESLIPIFAQRLEGGIKCAGANKHFGWLQRKREAAAKGGRSKTEAKTKHLKQNRSQPKPTEASPSPSYSFSNSPSQSSLIAISKKSPSPLGVYISAYEEKYAHRPPVGPREGKILKTFSENHPDRWQELIQGYLQMPDSWAVQRSHPVEVLVSKVNEIGRFLATGKVVTKKVVQHAEEMIDKAQGTHRKPRKSLEELERERAEMMAEANAPKAIGGKP